MAIYEVDELFEGRSGNFSVSDGRKYVRKFRAFSNYAGDGPQTVLNSFFIRRGDPYITITDNDPNAFAMNLSCEQEEGDQLCWIVTVDYGWYDVNEAGGGPNQNPLNMPIDVTFGFRDYEHVVQADINNKPILNSAGDPYNPPVVINLPNQLLTVVRNEASYDSAMAYSYRNSINSDSFAGQSALFAKTIAITPKNIFHQDIGWYYQVTYEFEFLNPRNAAGTKGWHKILLDQGYRQLDPVTKKPVAITLKGQPITQPMLLDGNGHLLPLNGVPYYNEFQVFVELPYSNYNFDEAAITGNRTGFY
jgi:hypothetical protein